MIKNDLRMLGQFTPRQRLMAHWTRILSQNWLQMILSMILVVLSNQADVRRYVGVDKVL